MGLIKRGQNERGQNDRGLNERGLNERGRQELSVRGRGRGWLVARRLEGCGSA
jgi:hypothetical protein